MGIGAAAYYRRVVENQKDRLFNEIIKVGKKLSFPASLLRELEAAKAEVQFRKAIEVIKTALPVSLYIHDRDPLRLLHAALSKDIHNSGDAECLENAGDIRVILTELSMRLLHVLCDDRELQAAVARLNRST